MSVALESEGEASPVIRLSTGGRTMGDDVTDRALLDLGGLTIGEPLDESALARALTRVLATSENGPSNSFSASI
jgi:hypothetical protein